MERNVDRVKRLTYELGRYRDKVSRQQTEINKLKKERYEGLVQLRGMVAALMKSVAIAYGREEPAGIYKIELPVANVTGLNDCYDYTVENIDRRTAVITVTQRAEDGKK